MPHYIYPTCFSDLRRLIDICDWCSRFDCLWRLTCVRPNDQTTSVFVRLLTWCAVCELVASGVFAIFATHTVSSLGTMRSYSSTFQIPVVVSRVAVNSSRTLLSQTTHSLHAALTAVSTSPAPVSGTPVCHMCTWYTHLYVGPAMCGTFAICIFLTLRKPKCN